jgi:AcrR family transcriptional regulator
MTQPTEKKEHLSDYPGARKTRRTEGLLKGDRQERVVESVLRATAEHLSQVGYAGLRVDDVAVLSGVNKTTIYRRWPSKAELVAAALEAVRVTTGLYDTGRVREDLIAMMLEGARFASSPMGRGIVRILQTERADPEVEKIKSELRDRQRAVRRGILERAIARGEIPASTDPGLVADILFGPIYARIIACGEDVDEPYVREVVEIVLAGVRARGI